VRYKKELTMQIDGHHTATYVAARIAGFSFKDAEIVSYAAQYVDDATNAGIVQFKQSDYLYSRIASAHKMIDYNNFVDVENHLAWIPFHFLPGNGLLPAGETPEGGELEKLICRPDSHIARDMLRYAAQDMSRARGLHRLGIAMHVYADTFAHQGFVGSLSIANQVKDLTSGDADLDKRIKEHTKKELFASISGNIKNFFQVLGRVLSLMWHEKRFPAEFIASFMHKNPVGHASADVYPDHPYLQWQYIDFNNQIVKRDNTTIFLKAMDMMVLAMQAWRAGDQTMHLEAQTGLGDADRGVLERLFRFTVGLDGEERRQDWLAAIGRGEFSFGAEVPTYIAKGAGSWKESALGTIEATDTGLERFPYKDSFLVSNWKLFHDALQIHRSDVVHEILPRYGICAA
jgi:hypothetical protein